MMQLLAKDEITHLLEATKSQIAADKEHLRRVWRGLMRLQRAIYQSKEAFFTSQELLKRLPENP